MQEASVVEEDAEKKYPSGSRVLLIAQQGDITMTEYDLVISSLSLPLIPVIVKSIAAANTGKVIGLVRKFLFRAKVRIVLVVNKSMNECRMHDRKPMEISIQCYICASRGGWSRCPRFKRIKND
jgi:hypothetical protein